MNSDPRPVGEFPTAEEKVFERMAGLGTTAPARARSSWRHRERRQNRGAGHFVPMRVASRTGRSEFVERVDPGSDRAAQRLPQIARYPLDARSAVPR